MASINTTASLEDLEKAAIEANERHSIMNKYSFNDMIIHFWKPLNSFYTKEEWKTMTGEEL
jgi:hypothetical protein